MSDMDSPSARLLRLLTLLQSRGRWTGAELADRLRVSPRTIRYDVDKLRQLGYDVAGETGTTGGYALRSGTTLPPLQFEDDEAVAIVLGLRLANRADADLGEAATTALLKFEQMMPARLRAQVNALRSYTTSVGPAQPAIDPDVIVFLAAACRDHRLVTFEYASRDGSASRRKVEPYRVVQMGRWWYLLAYDPDREDWRSFRLDRLEIRHFAGARFVPRDAPDPATMLSQTDAYYSRCRAVVLVDAPIEIVVARLPARVPVEPVDESHCRVHASAPTPEDLALNLVLIGYPFAIEHSADDLVTALGEVEKRIAAVTG